jgi:Short C-terminal domain
MPFVRRRPLLRAAMVGGVAYHAGKKTQEGRDADYDRDARIAELEAQQAGTGQQQAAPPPAAAPQADMVTQLEKLGQLKQQGILTDAEFEVQKQKILQGMS